MENVVTHIRQCYPVSDEALRKLEALVTPCRVPKRHLLVREGIYPKSAWFVERGLTR